MSLKRTGSNISTSGPAPRKKNARVSGRVDSDVALSDARGEGIEDEESNGGFPPTVAAQGVDTAASTAGSLVTSPHPSSSRWKENSSPAPLIHNGSPRSRKTKRKERQLSNKGQSSNGAQTEERPHTRLQKGKGREEVDLIVGDGEDYQFVHPGRKPNVKDVTALVTRMWTRQVEDIHSWTCDARSALQLSTSPVKSLYAVHTVGAMHKHIYTVTPQHPVFDGLAPRTRTFFLEIASGNLSTAVTNGIDSGALVLSPEGDARTSEGQFTYVRVPSPRDDSPECTPEACAWRYIERHSADLAWGVSSLLALGLDLDVVKQRLLQLAVKLQLDTDALAPLLESLSSTDFPRIQGFGLYFGVTDEQTPHDRLEQDLQEQHSRFNNWATDNADYVTWNSYYLDDLTLPTSSGLRTDSVGGDTEVSAITVSGAHGLNRAVGGFFPKFSPSPAASTLISTFKQSPSMLFGVDLAHDTTARVIAFLDDQKNYLRQHTAAVISDDSYQSVLQNGPGVFRRRGAFIPGLRFLDTISLEDFQARRGSKAVGGIWSNTTGRALKSFRHIASTLYPDIPPDGDLAPSLIASRLGPTFNVWPLTTDNVHFWLHCLFTSRIIIETGAIVTSSWSEVVDSIFSGGYLHLAWRTLPPGLQQTFLEGRTPAHIQDFLPEMPSDTWTPEKTTVAGYILKVGELRILRCGPRSTDLIVNISNLHTGGIKHDPATGFEAHSIILSVELLNRMALEEVCVMEKEGMVLDRKNGSAEDVWGFLEALVSRTNARAVACGLREELNEHKSQYQLLNWAQGHLRSIGRKPPSARVQAEDFAIPGVTHAVGDPHSVERRAQFDELKHHYRELSRGGADPDPFHVIPYRFHKDPFGQEMQEWFLERRRDRRLANAATASGTNPESYARSVASHAALSANKPALSFGGLLGTDTLRQKREEREDPTKLLLEFVQAIKNWRTCTLAINDKTGSRTSNGWRAGICRLCGKVVIANNQNSKHACEPREPAEVIQNNTFHSLFPLPYLHSALNFEPLRRLLPTFLLSLGIVTVSVCEILSRPENKALVDRELPDLKLERAEGLFVYRAEDEAEPEWLEVTMAIDVCLEFVCSCPPNMWPTKAEQRNYAWAHEGKLKEWTGSGGKQRHFVICNHGYCGVLQPKYTSGIFLHVCGRARDIAKARGCGTGDLNKKKGGDQDCGSTTSHPIKSQLDLSPDHLRSLWFHKRVFPKLIFSS
ncbi:hypothetical protein R3P38DRAFT_3549781 [Favolaschia claudopus]|uniref:Uncharacterized protein n=1 Tax=Favolaschia claudopus TaxID=2862362 RepID=A0AAW0B3Y3_9AGAR